MIFTLPLLRQLLAADGNRYARELADDETLRHFKSGANAAWSKRWEDSAGNHDLGRAEDWYESWHGAAAAAAFADGWC